MAGYKAKTIKAIISRKISQWVATIEDKDLAAQVANNVIVTGGAIVSLLQGEDVNDFDVYLRNYDTAKNLAEYYVARFQPRAADGIAVPLYVEADGSRVRVVAKSAGIVSESGTLKPYQYFEMHPEQRGEDYVSDVMDRPEQIADAHEETEALALNTTSDGKPKYRPVFMTSNAITLSDKLQIVLRFHGNPDVIHENYDFVHCTSYWSSWDNRLVLCPEALESILAKELRYVGSKYPVCSVVRLRKFISRGWKINAGQILKMAMQISALDLTDINVLEDQLTGVDTSYFIQLINSLKDKDPQKVNTAYLVEIVDRLF